MSTPQTAVIVRDVAGKGRGVFATRLFGAGDRVIESQTVAVSAVRTPLSFQTGWDRHVDLDEPARVVNHSCAPNTAVTDNGRGGYDLVAVRPISPGEEITWDYETTEYEIIGIERCLCGAAECRGRPRGFRHRALAGPPIVAERLADYLREAAATAWPSSGLVPAGPAKGTV